jgi:hypothetical protein
MSPDRLKREIAAVFQVVKDRSTEDELCVVCPVPGCEDRTGNRHINVKTLHTHCWRCREPQPHHVTTLFRTAGLEFTDDHAGQFKSVAELFQPEVKKALTPVQTVELPNGFELLSENRKSCYWRFCRDMAERKHLGIEDLEEAGAGFTREGLWEPFCIFPVYEGPRLVYYQGRTYSDEGFETTKKFPSKKVVPYGPSYWVYNLDALASKEVQLVIVVESILNVLSLRRRLRELDYGPEIVPVCIFTHRLSRSQAAKFQRYRHIQEFCLLFDSDSTALATEAAMILEPRIPVTVASMPVGTNRDGTVRKTNDANDDVDAALRAIADRKPPSQSDLIIARRLTSKPIHGGGEGGGLLRLQH